MNNQDSWNQEYQSPQLITKHYQPQKDFLRFIAWIKKNKHIDLYSDITVLDLGCGTGRNSFYMADHYDAVCHAWDFSEAAIETAKSVHSHLNISFKVRNIAQVFPLEDNSVDIILDVTASNALSEQERTVYLSECRRVLKPGGYMYVRTLAKEGDKNAQNLIKQFPGKDHDTYDHPQLKVTERVFTGPDFKELYNQYLEVVRMERKTGYQKWDNQSYKRNYWNVYIKS